MWPDVLRFDLRLRRRMLLWTAGGVVTYVFLIVAVYPSFKGDTSLDAMIQANPAAASAFGISGSITTPAGWLNANVYANIGPLLALLLTIGYGAAAVAGQDADGTLGLLATLPMSRTRLVLAKTWTLLPIALVVPVATLVVCLAGPRFALTPDWGALLGVTVTLTLLAFIFGACAMFVGALTGSRGAATGAASALAAAAYLISSLGPVVPELHSIRWLSPFSWAVGNDQLAHGPITAEMLALLGLAAALAVATIPAFRRLDIH